MFAAADVHYPPSGGARAALVMAADARFSTVIGVAKTRLVTAVLAVPVIRGSAKRPLYVTSAGVPLANAADLIRTMTGEFRLPDALRRVDALARGTRVLSCQPWITAGRRVR